LHTRVFVNSQGLPTYEAKDLGLAKVKNDKWEYSRSIIVTANEQDGYFQVVLKAMSLIFPDLAKRTTHMSHGMMRLPTGKMSSRTGDVVPAITLIDEIKERVQAKAQSGGNKQDLTDETLTEIAVAALKYSILRQTIGKDIVFDFDKSISFEGDSGPYLQYSAVRAQSVIDKAKDFKKSTKASSTEVGNLERLLVRFPEIIERSYIDLAPQMIVTYLTELASTFNSFYANNLIIDEKNAEATNYRLILCQAFHTVMQNGLDALGIKVPAKM